MNSPRPPRPSDQSASSSRQNEKAYENPPFGRTENTRRKSRHWKIGSEEARLSSEGTSSSGAKMSKAGMGKDLDLTGERPRENAACSEAGVSAIRLNLRQSCEKPPARANSGDVIRQLPGSAILRAGSRASDRASGPTAGECDPAVRPGRKRPWGKIRRPGCRGRRP